MATDRKQLNAWLGAMTSDHVEFFVKTPTGLSDLELVIIDRPLAAVVFGPSHEQVEEGWVYELKQAVQAQYRSCWAIREGQTQYSAPYTDARRALSEYEHRV